MKDFRPRTTAMLFGLFCATMAYAQRAEPTAPTAVAVPKLVRFSGSFRPSNGTPAQTMESVTLSVYRNQTGGEALWHEIQNVVVDAEGHYSVLMGATQNEGMPLELFTSGEPRWLGAQFNRPGEAEQARVLLVSVPYALKAADADTLGGKPSSAYLLAAPTVGTDTASVSSGAVASPTTTIAVKPKATLTNNGLPNFIGKFTNTTDLIDSSMYETGGNVGISTVTPLISLDVRTGSLPQMGIAGTTDYLTFFASDTFGPAIYWDPSKDMRFGKGGASLYNPFGFVEYMRIQSSTGNVGIGTLAPGSKLDVAGDINFSGIVRYQGNPVLQISAANFNTALGLGSLPGNTTGVGNTATGQGTLAANTTGGGNTATGQLALTANTTGTGNTGTGADALGSNTTGINNTATGLSTLFANTTGQGNTASGVKALTENNIGSQNTAEGFQALFANSSGNNNTAIGWEALGFNTTGSNNIAIGNQAGASVSPANSNNIHIGSPGVSGDAATTRIGTMQTSFFASGISGVAVNNASPVLVDPNGQLGVAPSSRRFKEDIQDMGAASRDLMSLRPVTFRYRKPFSDGTKPIQYGLIAEEVAEVYPDLVVRSDGEIQAVKYQVLDSMLLNEVQRQQAEIRGLVQQIDEQHQQNQSLLERLSRLEAALASMSETSKLAAAR